MDGVNTGRLHLIALYHWSVDLGIQVVDTDWCLSTETVTRRGGGRLASMTPAVLHSPRRSSEDSMEESFSLKELRVSFSSP